MIVYKNAENTPDEFLIDFGTLDGVLVPFYNFLFTIIITVGLLIALSCTSVG